MTTHTEKKPVEEDNYFWCSLVIRCNNKYRQGFCYRQGFTQYVTDTTVSFDSGQENISLPSKGS